MSFLGPDTSRHGSRIQSISVDARGCPWWTHPVAGAGSGMGGQRVELRLQQQAFVSKEGVIGLLTELYVVR